MFSVQTISMVKNEDPAEISGPTEKDADTFKTKGESALAAIGVTDVSKTGLPDSCGLAMYACADKILICADSRLVKTSTGGFTPVTSVCNCFVRGATDSIPISGETNKVFTCPFACVSDLMSMAAKYVSNANGPTGSSLTCDLSEISNAAFGNKNKYIPTAADTDSLEMAPVDDSSVQRAAEALRININSVRLAQCPATQPYDAPGTVKYAKKGMSSAGKGQYRLEVVYGSDVVFARIAHLPRSQQVIDPGTQARLHDSENLNGRFVLMSITPGPCDNAVAEQLAVTVTGAPHP
jgi:hypothetical protein